MPAPQPKVFISYARARSDEAFVRRLRQALTAAIPGITFYTERQITAGDAWAEMITRMIERSDAILVVVSDTFQSSSWTSFEMGVALAEREQRNKRIIPILLGTSPPTSPLLSRFSFIDFRDPKDFDRAAAELADAIISPPQDSSVDESDLDVEKIYVAAREQQFQLTREHEEKLLYRLYQDGLRRSFSGFLVTILSIGAIVAAFMIVAHRENWSIAQSMLPALTGIIGSAVGFYFGQHSVLQSGIDDLPGKGAPRATADSDR